jgi:hypothetical protein
MAPIYDPGVTSKWAERARSSPYYPALSHPVFRKVLPGTAASALGDGMSAVIGELSAPFLRRWPVWPVMTAIVLGWGLALVPFGLPTPLWIGLAAFTAGAVIWGPWMSLSMSVFQDASPPGALAQVLAARSSLLILAAPIGIALGAPLVAALGARDTLLVSALATIALGLVTIAALLLARRAG